MVRIRVLGGDLIDLPKSDSLAETRRYAAEALSVDACRIELVHGTQKLQDECSLLGHDGDIAELQVVVLPDPAEEEVLKQASLPSWEVLQQKKKLDLKPEMPATMADYAAMLRAGAIRKMSRLPDRLGKDLAGTLEELNLDGNSLEELPGSFDQLVKLTALSVQGNCLALLPKDFGHLVNLEVLQLQSNKLEHLPASFARLSKLRHLSVRRNKLTALPDVLWDMASLQILEVSDNQLVVLPESLSKCTALQQLLASRNQLGVLPWNLGDLTALQVLELDENKLVSLPESIGQLTALERMDIRQTSITVLPTGFGQLSTLQHFQVDIMHMPLLLRHELISCLPARLQTSVQFQESAWSSLLYGMVKTYRTVTRRCCDRRRDAVLTTERQHLNDAAVS